MPPHSQPTARTIPRWSPLLLACLIARPVAAQVVQFEGDILPEEMGFEHVAVYDPVRWIEDGWFFVEIDQGQGTGGPYDGDLDKQTFSLVPFFGAPFFVEWRVMTNAPNSEVDVHNGGAFLIVVGGYEGRDIATYHVNIARGLARLLRGYPYPTIYFDIEPGVPHTYRLEVYGGDYFEFRVDDVVIDSGETEGDVLEHEPILLFGARYYLSEHTTQWDYVRFGTIPAPGSGDYDSDGDLDLVDYRLLCECVTGPDTPATAGCVFADMDGDDAVDLADIALFQRAFTGTE